MLYNGAIVRVCSHLAQDTWEVVGMNKFVRLFVGLIVLAGLILPFSAAAQGPLTYGSSFQVQNLEDQQASITITFYDQAGAAVDAATVQDSIAASGSKTYFAVQMANLPTTFAGSAVISSDRRLRAIHNLAANNYTFGASSAGYTEGATEVNLPLIMRGNSGYNTWFAVQNAGTSDAVVTVAFKKGSAGNDFTAAPVTIKPGASHLWYQADMAQLGDKFIGSAKVTSVGAPVVATVVEVGPTTLYAYDGFVAASPNFIAPLFQYYNSGYSSSIQVQNAGATATNVTVEYIPSFAGNACEETRTIAAGAAGTYGLAAFNSAIAESNCYVQNPGTPFIGSARVKTNSANQPLVAIVNQHNFGAGKAASYSAFRPEDGTRTVSLPLVMDRNSNYWTGITVYNAGSAATTVTIDYSGAPPNMSFSLNAGESKVILNNGQLGDRYIGSAVVSGANTTDKLLVIVNELNTVAAGDTFYVYNGFNY